MVAKKDLAHLGERKVIERLLSRLDKMADMPIPFGDDVAGYPLSDRRLLILKTDMLVGKTDVPPGMSLRQAARKAIVMNVSDFAAKGVQPIAAQVSLGLPRSLNQDSIDEIAEGINEGIHEYGAYVLGGDTGEADDVIIAPSFFGIAPQRERIMLRSGAKPNDIVGVTGAFGSTAAGLRTLLGHIDVPTNIRERLVDSVLVPHARLKEGLALGRSRAVTASIDSSDGLAWSLHEIARLSHVGFLIDDLRISKDAEKFAELNRLDSRELALYGGEEYELVVTISPELLRTAIKAAENAGGKLHALGKVTAKKDILIEIDGQRKRIEARGWEHFKTKGSPHRQDRSKIRKRSTG